ncbi:D-aminopeptidase [Pseudogemmobacter bohemicus]|uniref:D-aminopeptidase n=1 Tax=Pseudogemmobacter bohemicus TaxID=2250708 RepID=UPI000DD4703B|nr:D-aminopeptidase [Pseudogemmobacter bohemicus]
MSRPSPLPLAEALDLLPRRFAGPGGVAVVLKDGREVAARAWGYASLETHQPMTRATRLPICSISKQFTCGALLAEFGSPEALDRHLPEFLPELQSPRPLVRQMCHNQSGLRDYWAMTVIEGAKAEQTFGKDAAVPMVAAIHEGHFAPGSGYSYCNCNFRLLPELIRRANGRDLVDLYHQHIWGPAGMKTATLTADTRHPEDGVTGYEGRDVTGYFPADNGIYWVGDAGISASLDDMLAYEAWIDATREDEAGLYRRLSAPVTFSDGNPALYSFGLAHQTSGGVKLTGHGGALRGFRAQRLHAAEARISVVVMFNHEASAHDAAHFLMRAALGQPEPEYKQPEPGWAGQWLCPGTGLIARLEPAETVVKLHFATGAEALHQIAPGVLASDETRLERQGDHLHMRRLRDNIDTVMAPLAVLELADGTGIAGRYHCAETGASLRLEARDKAVFALFSGRLGEGRMEPVLAAGPDVWLIRTRRSMDAPAPGDWTLQIRRDGAGRVAGLTLGCWLARGLDYERQG